MKTAEQHNLPLVGKAFSEKLVTDSIAHYASQGGARVSSGKDSKQDYETPWNLITAIEHKFKTTFGIDLAATEENKKAPFCITEEQDSIKTDWLLYRDRLAWLNPPFKRIGPWAEKCAAAARHGMRIVMLTPASVDSLWWSNWVHNQAHVFFLQPRVHFDGACDPFMKPLTLSCYNLNLPERYQPWRWL
jgi:phage N-6-adenine-methyltransferase